MKKLKLELDELRVESFETARTHERRGTVQAHSGGYQTCDAGCGPTFLPEASCYDTGCPQEGSVGLSCACVTMDCTANPMETYCINSYEFCVETQRPQATCRLC